jgi:hypothetical protein
MKFLFSRCARMLRQWKLLHTEEGAEKLGAVALDLEARAIRPPRLTWKPGLPQQTSASESSAHENSRDVCGIHCNICNVALRNRGGCGSETRCETCIRPITAMN